MTSTLPVLHRGDALAAWELSAIAARDFPGEPAPASDPQNYRYINGFVDVGDLPCRVATWREVAVRTRTLETDWQVESLNLPGSNRRVEFSQFRHTPTRLERWCRTRVSSGVDRYVSFRLETRGGIHIWVDGTLAARFEPFTRNSTQATIVHLPIRAEGSEIVVLTEDMAERDTNWFFELALVDDTELTIELPGAAAGTHAGLLGRIASELRPTRDVVSDTSLTLRIDTPAAHAIAIDATIGSTSHDKSLSIARTVVLPAGATEVELASNADLPNGYLTIQLTLSLEDTRVDRTIGCAVLRQTMPQQFAPTLAERKRMALEHLAANGERRIGTALAALALGQPIDARLHDIITHTLEVVEQRRDCSDFVLVPLLWAWQRYSTAFPEDLDNRIRQVVLDYRYWVDEPGNDVMWFWSENHALCFHVCQLLAGGLLPDKTFSTSGRTGAQQRELARERLSQWFDAVEEDGLAEWNSAAYYPVDLIGLLALVELAPADIAARARAVTDRIFTMVALHTTGGVPAGSMGRAYNKELRAGPLTELAPFTAVAWGRGWMNRGVASLPQFAAGAYEPPAKLERLAWPEPGTVLRARYTQGFGEAARLALVKTPHFQLSANTSAKAGQFGHQQHVVDLLFASHPFARAWINHPGEDDPYGQQRPSYWAGNLILPHVAQHDDAALVLYDLGADPRIDFTHAFIGADAISVEPIGNALLLGAGEGHAAILATAPLEPVTTGPAAGREYRVTGRRAGWVILVDTGTDRDGFRRRVESAALRLGSDGMTFTLAGEPSSTLTWDGELLIAGTPVPRPHLDRAPSIITD